MNKKILSTYSYLMVKAEMRVWAEDFQIRKEDIWLKMYVSNSLIGFGQSVNAYWIQTINMPQNLLGTGDLVADKQQSFST